MSAIILTVESVRTRASTGDALITFAVPIEQAVLISGFMSKIGKQVGAAFADVEPPDVAPKISATGSVKTYGNQASELYRNGFFYALLVLEAIGSDAGFRAWVATQPCCASENGSAYCEGDIVAAHVRRVAAGAGVALKPDYSTIPLCHRHHTIQHQHGEDAIGGKDYCDKQRNRCVVHWASHELAAKFGKVSMGFVEPAELLEWAEEHGIAHLLPQAYRKAG